MNSNFLSPSILIIFFIIITSICKVGAKYIITEFILKYPLENETNYFYDDYTNNYLFAKIKLGSNMQTVEMKIDLNLYETYIVKEDIVDTKKYVPYNANASKTFNTSVHFYSQGSDFPSAYLANDNLIYNDGQNEFTLNNFYFAYVNVGFNKFAGSIGFNLKTSIVYPEQSMNYIDQLKNNSIISGYSLTIKFSSNYKGSLLIGADPEEIIPKEIEKYKKSVVKASGKGIIDDGKWVLELKQALIGDFELVKSNLVDFNLKYDFIMATDEFSDYIIKNYFNKYFVTEKCFREELRTFKYFQGIKCKKDVDVTDFPNITFSIYSEFGPLYLVLDYEDLFEEKGDYKYFRIIITYNDDVSSIKINKNWIFGKLFFKLYLVTLNKDRKDITIYYQEKKKKGKDSASDTVDPNSQLNEGESSKMILIWILIIILVIMAVIIAILLIKCIKQGKIIKRRNRLNILDDVLNDEKIN
jgi:hypothetical protein